MLETNENQPALWEQLSKETLAEYEIFSVARCKLKNLSNNKSGDFYIIDCNNWVQVVAETSTNQIVMVYQYRFGSHKLSLELPGGIMEQGENVIEAAQRELEEETGFCGDSAKIIATLYPNPAIQTNVLSVVLIKNCTKKKDTHFDEFEDLTTSLMTKQNLMRAVATGEISHCITIASIAKYILL
ncbi:MAG: NUDIX hydrolase [Puniceicoccales bacterium]|jgi:ADP-ribose pyrophosphatase YjhB (NUDIX family)|nr:NUDIX hydrolase [Puniceicoccales bacterium]